LPASAEEFNSDGVKIHYVVQGQGEPVILVHGLGSSAWMNWQMPGTVARLAKHFQVIALDIRGHGASGKPTGQDQYGEQMSEDVVRLMDHLHIEKARVVGYSLGSFIVMKLLTTHPERVSSAVMGGAAWLRAGSPLQHVFMMMPVRANRAARDCVHGIAGLATTEQEVKAIKAPVTILVGDRDPCRQMYVEPALRVRPDWTVRTIASAGHFNCIVMPEFKNDLESALMGGK
jgi:pimeloyl-ACP methyl ester carboxylesterase